MTTLILRVNAGGQPVEWLPWQQAVLLYVKDQVIWTHGDEAIRIRGGVNRRSGRRSFIELHPVVAVRGTIHRSVFDRVPPLTNRELFRRDRHTCMYCLARGGTVHLTRDHLVPVSRGGQDVWSNVVTACRGCNNRKRDRTPQEANMRLHAVPYEPNHAEWLILRNRRILADQMRFLTAQCPQRRDRPAEDTDLP